MNYSYTNADGRRSLVVILDTGNAHTIPGSHPKFTELLHYLGNTADPDDQHVRRLIDFGADAADTLQRLSDRVTHRLGTIRFDGEIIDTALTRHLVRMIKDGDDRYTGLVRFMENLAANPSRKSRHRPEKDLLSDPRWMIQPWASSSWSGSGGGPAPSWCWRCPPGCGGHSPRTDGATAFDKAGAAAVQTAGNPTSDYGQQVALIDVSVFVTFVTLLTVGIVVQNRDIPTDGLRRRLTDGRGLLVGGRLSGTVLYIAVIVIALHIRTIFAVTTSLQGIPAPSERAVVDGAYLVSDGFQSVTAGLWEEICLFAVPIALLSMRKRSGVSADQAPEVFWRWGPVRWTLILITVLALRSGIHLYYGWGGVFVVPWMIGAVLLYRALRSIWPLVIGHIIYDILVDLRNRLPVLNDVIAVALWGFVVAGVLIVVLSIIRRRQRVQALPGSPISGDDRPPAAPTSESLHG